MGVKEDAKVIGKAGIVKVAFGDEMLTFPIEVLDVRNVYGRTDYRIKPQLGEGSAWVSASRVTVW